MNIYVGNLSWNLKDQDLANMFAEFGEVTSAKIINDKFTGRSKGFGFVEMSSDDEAQKAISEFNGASAEGRTLTVNEARPMAPREGGGGGTAGGGGGRGADDFGGGGAPAGGGFGGAPAGGDKRPGAFDDDLDDDVPF